MNDDDLITTVRERFAPVRMHVPAKTLMARGTARRRRRHGGQFAAGALAVALGAGLGVPALTTSSGNTAGAQHATLAAWTVDRKPGGAIAVTIRKLRDLPALQRELASDGARITISADTLLMLPKSCISLDIQMYDGQRVAVFQLSPGVGHGQPSEGLVFTLYPNRIPPGQVLRVTVFGANYPPLSGTVASGNPHESKFPGMMGFTSGQYRVFETSVRDTPACTN